MFSVQCCVRVYENIHGHGLRDVTTYQTMLCCTLDHESSARGRGWLTHLTSPQEKVGVAGDCIHSPQDNIYRDSIGPCILGSKFYVLGIRLQLV